MGQAFQMTPNGIAPMSDDPTQADPAPAAVQLPRAPQPMQQALPAIDVASVDQPVAQQPAPKRASLVGNRQLVKDARSRLRELKTAIRADEKRLRQMKSERDELQRLLNAAKQKPTAKVRSIRSA